MDFSLFYRLTRQAIEYIYSSNMTQNQYYILYEGNKEGPLDMVTLMRRIRANKVTMDTLIFADDATTPARAQDIESLSIFFSHTTPKLSTEKTSSKENAQPLFTVASALREGWRFTLEHNNMTVFAGGIVLICLLLLGTFVGVMGTTLSILITCCVFFVLQYIYLLFCFGLLRGQKITSSFINVSISPILNTIVLAALYYAMMMVGGFIALVIPAIFVGMYYMFLPCFIFDRKMSVIEAMNASRLLGKKCNGQYHTTLFLLILGYIISILLIIPIPLAMPIFSAALVKIYDELSAA
jgi:hypothetical protein